MKLIVNITKKQKSISLALLIGFLLSLSSFTLASTNKAMCKAMVKSGSMSVAPSQEINCICMVKVEFNENAKIFPTGNRMPNKCNFKKTIHNLGQFIVTNKLYTGIRFQAVNIVLLIPIEIEQKENLFVRRDFLIYPNSIPTFIINHSLII